MYSQYNTNNLGDVVVKKILKASLALPSHWHRLQPSFQTPRLRNFTLDNIQNLSLTPILLRFHLFPK